MVLEFGCLSVWTDLLMAEAVKLYELGKTKRGAGEAEGSKRR